MKVLQVTRVRIVVPLVGISWISGRSETSRVPKKFYIYSDAVCLKALYCIVHGLYLHSNEGKGAEQISCHMVIKRITTQ